jgi:hypothetical protein
MISDAAIRTIHEACKTDRLYIVIRRDGTAWIMEGDTIKEIADKAESLWNQLPWSVSPIVGVVPTPKVEL